MLIVQSLYLTAALLAGSTTLGPSVLTSASPALAHESCRGHAQFLCSDETQCIPKQWRCDSIRDCRDGSDEFGCTPISPAPSCPEKYRKCGVTNQTSGVACVHKKFWCDGIRNCANGADETFCISNHLYCMFLPGNFRCKYGDIHGDEKCVHFSQMCDGKVDCVNGTDEDAALCKPGNVTSQQPVTIQPPTPSLCVGQFRCHSGHVPCVPSGARCNIHHNCADGSDELNCSIPSPTIVAAGATTGAAGATAGAATTRSPSIASNGAETMSKSYPMGNSAEPLKELSATVNTANTVNYGLVIGVSCAGAVVLLVIVIGAILLYRSRQRRESRPVRFSNSSESEGAGHKEITTSDTNGSHLIEVAV